LSLLDNKTKYEILDIYLKYREFVIKQSPNKNLLLKIDKTLISKHLRNEDFAYIAN